jgi:hypothetical protein
MLSAFEVKYASPASDSNGSNRNQRTFVHDARVRIRQIREERGEAKMKLKLTGLFLLVFAATCSAQTTTGTTPQNPPAPPSYKAGGTLIVIPSPTTDMVEVGDEARGVMEVAVPDSNRLIAAYLLPQDLPLLTKGSESPELTKYALVEVPRNGEYSDVEASDFKEIMDGASQEIGAILSSSFSETEDEFNRRLKDLNVNATVSLGKPVQLGALFAKTDAFGFGLITQVTVGTSSSNMAMAAAIIRVRKRVIFAYLYAEYKNDDTVKWLRKSSEDWADAILKANQ